MYSLKRVIILVSATLFVVTVASARATATNSTSPATAVSSQQAAAPEAPAQMQSRGGSPASEDTFVTFSGPVALPGLVLPAGTYLFRHLAPGHTSRRHVVQVLSADRSKIYATLQTVPNTRLTRTDEPTIVFRETPAGQPQVIRAWFYPGDPVGDEFVFPATSAAAAADAR
ncbi:MAG: hypothetical protein KGN76_17405 [Acidobacteriota bacterium]|nr:hypothetical protein [Acidobacteriota bacterium]